MRLDHKLEAFCNAIINGKTQSDAYRAYNPSTKATNASIAQTGSEIASRPEVKRRIAEMQDILEAQAAWKRVDSIRVLKEIIAQPESHTACVSALNTLTKMLGHNEPERHEVSNTHEFTAPTLSQFYADGSGIDD